MKLRHFAPGLALAALAAPLAVLPTPVDAQERRERIEIEREAPRARTLPRVLEMTRGPRAVLGLSTTDAGRADTLGVLVGGVTEDGPAARAGIREGARLQSVDGVSLRISPSDADDPIVRDLGMRRLTRELGRKKPGDEVELRVLDGSTARTVRVRLADADSLYRARVMTARGPAPALRAAMANRASLGVQVGSNGSRRDTLGVFVMSADDDGPAAKAGIIEGARIASINGVDLRVAPADAEDDLVARSRVQRLMRALADVKPGDEVELRVWSNGQYRTTRVRTVPADSLRRSRGTMIFGENFNFESGPAIAFPRGDMGAFRYELSPSMHLELERSVTGARRSAQEVQATALRRAHEALAAARQSRASVGTTYH